MSISCVNVSYNSFYEIIDTENEDIIGLYEDPFENEECFKVATISNENKVTIKCYLKDDLRKELGLEDCKINRIWNDVGMRHISMLISGRGIPYNKEPYKGLMVGFLHENKVEIIKAN